MYEINAPHLLFLLPGNHARQRIKPGGLLSPACFPPRDTWNVKHDELFPLGQATEQLLSAQLEPPTSSPELTWFLFPSHSPGSTPLLPNHWKNTAISFRSAEGEHLPAARLLLPFSFWGALGSPEACHQAVERVARRSSAIHLPHAFRSQRQHDAPVPEAGMLLPLPAAPRRGQGGGTSLPGNLCGSRAGEEASAPRVPPRRVAPLLFVCRGSFRRPKAPIQK